MIDLDALAVANRIRELRGNLTQAEFARRLGLERKTVGRYENGERTPDALTILRLMTEFDVNPIWLLTGGTNTPGLNADESELLALFRSAPLAGKMAAVGALRGVAESDKRQVGSKQIFNSSVGNAAGGNMTVDQRNTKRGKK